MTFKCCFCNVKFEGYGNSALPLRDGVCCDVCNIEKVIPERIRRLEKYQNEEHKRKDHSMQSL